MTEGDRSGQFPLLIPSGLPQLPHRLLQARIAQVSIPRRRLWAAMPEYLPDRVQIHTLVYQH